MPDYYYPLVEIVTISLGKFLHDFNMDQVKATIKELDINLGEIEEDDTGALIFTLIPNAEKLDKSALMKRYGLLKRLMQSA